MDSTHANFEVRSHVLRATAYIGQNALLFILSAIQITVFAVLALLEPFIRVGLSLVAIGGIALSLFYRYVAHAPHYPFWPAVGVSVGCAVLLVLYYKLMRLITP